MARCSDKEDTNSLAPESAQKLDASVEYEKDSADQVSMPSNLDESSQDPKLSMRPSERDKVAEQVSGAQAYLQRLKNMRKEEVEEDAIVEDSHENSAMNLAN